MNSPDARPSDLPGRAGVLAAALLIPLSLMSACFDRSTLAVSSSAEVFLKAQPALEMEPDVELAAAAFPAMLKTLEGFHLAEPDNPILVDLLAKGFCQYATAFVEDEIEQALAEGELDRELAQSRRGALTYLRCLNYALLSLPPGWRSLPQGDPRDFEARVAQTEREHRDAMMWAGIGLAGAIHTSRDDIELVALLPRAVAILERVIELDDQRPPKDPMARALPHLALAIADTSRGAAVGGHPERGKAHFERALELTQGRLLLAKVFYARGYARISGDRALFRRLLIEVLQTDPAIWPEQRLAGEIAHRRARRYLEMEDQWF